jgi:4-hydroxy-2-oxoheptanedioate aldolase
MATKETSMGMVERMRGGARLLNGFCSIASPHIALLMARQGFDSVTVDLQHGLIDYDRALSMLTAIHAGGAASLCRVPGNDEAIIGKVLDAGFSGVICPMINSPEDARALVAACRYPPHGSRSWGPVGAGLAFGPDYTENSPSIVSVFAMIETSQAFEAVEAILAVDGLDGIYVGPSDLALTMGFDPRNPADNPQVMEAIYAIGRAAALAGKPAGIHCGSGEVAAAMLDQGYGFATLSSDFALLRAALAAEIALARPGVSTTTSGGY